MAKVGIVKIRQTTRPSFVSQNYSAKVNISDLGGVNLANVKDNDILVYSSNTGLWEVETSDFSIFLSSADRTNAAYDQANAATILAGTPSHVANSASAYANGAFLTANSLIPFTQAAFLYANGTAAHSNAVNDTQNTNISFNWNHSNSSFIQSNASFAVANSASIYANGAFEVSNSASIYANGAFITANTPSHVANSASVYANGAFITANTADDRGTSAGIYANGAFAVANSASIYANGAFAKANNEAGVNATQNTNITNAQNTADAGFIHANASFNAANNVFPQIQPSYNTANAAFIRANNSLNANNGGTITGDLSISGNLSVLGNTFTVSATTIVANDTVILLGAGNYTSDLLDIGISAHYNDGVNAHTGFIRDHGTKEWQLFEGYTGEIGANNDIDINDPSFRKATLNANLKSQSITLNSQDLQTYIDKAYTRANNSLNANTGGAIGGNVIPTTDNTYYLGSETNRWHSLYVGPGSIDLGGLVIQNQGNVLTVSVGNGLPTPIAGSDEYARNHVNAAFNFANTSYIETTYAENHANAAFILANNINGIDLTQNNRITYASNHANLAFSSANVSNAVNLTQNNRITYSENHANSSFNHANSSFNHANSSFGHANSSFGHANAAFLSANNSFRNSYDSHGKFKISANEFGRYIIPSISDSHNPGIYVEAGKTYAFELNIPFVDYGLTLRYFSRFGATVANVTHISTSGVVTANSTADRTTGTLYWTVPYSDIGLTVVYCSSIYNGLSGRIEIINPALYQNTSDLANSTTLRSNSSFNHANAAFSWANAAYTAANNAAGGDTFARNTANAAFLVANSTAAYSNTVNNTQNTTISFAFNHANSSFAVANSASIYANGAFLVANSTAAYSNTVNNTQNTNISFAFNHANASFNSANSNFANTSAAGSYANGAFAAANSASIYANGAFAAANSASIYANGAFAKANSAEAHALNAVSKIFGGNVSALVAASALKTNTYIEFGDGSRQYVANAGSGGGSSANTVDYFPTVFNITDFEFVGQSLVSAFGEPINIIYDCSLEPETPKGYVLTKDFGYYV